MAVIALASASGAPGVTTTALALTLLWPRPVLLVEASPYGGSAVLAGYLRGAVAPEDRSLLGLAKAQRQGRLREAIEENAVALDDEGRRRVLPAVPRPEQAPSLGALWHPLVALLPELTDDDGEAVDVIVDAGRLGAAHGPDPLVHAADVTLLCLRTQLPAVATAAARAGALRGVLGGPVDTAGDGVSGSVGGGHVGLLLVGEGRPYTGREIGEVCDVPVIAAVAWDQPAAEVLALGAVRPRRWEHSAFIRSCSAVAESLQRQLPETSCELALVDGSAA